MKKFFPTEPPAFVGDEPRPRITYYGYVNQPWQKEKDSFQSVEELMRELSIKPGEIKCECGAALLGAKPNGPEHSDWCPLGVAR